MTNDFEVLVQRMKSPCALFYYTRDKICNFGMTFDDYHKQYVD